MLKLSDRVRAEWFRQTIPTRWVEADEIAVSGVGTVAVAKVIPLDDGEPFIAASMYGAGTSRSQRTGPATGIRMPLPIP